MKIKRKCLTCRKEFETYPSLNKKFCSNKCFYISLTSTGKYRNNFRKKIRNSKIPESRISFNYYDMEYLYSIANFEDNNLECKRLKKRIEKFLGQRSINNIKRKK
ncbi:MAG TPA: hypothetical protein PLF93_02145 [Candidatus Pacearchaeota archaeon]|jgi:endogenous inhibitor of DNA gyrase (YacG/DUF329 family)|nr:hypothetical protein [Methanofastidiosum sp.]HPM39241.1 hypothetical protein [Candidatus Pacearchaeota archaeon]HPX52125.1 hypothetical protein [Candidatus Pacearchaeota archaeon]